VCLYEKANPVGYKLLAALVLSYLDSRVLPEHSLG
jgi:hypothetical protein